MHDDDRPDTGAPALPPGVALTAAAMAQERAAESRRPDRLFDDPWADRLVAAAAKAGGAPWLAEGVTLGQLVPALDGYVALRTRWLDDRIRAEAGEPAAGAVQVVLLGAGLDTRAFRLPWPGGTSVFLLDQPGVVAFARYVLGELGSATWVPADLTGRWERELTAAGFRPATPTVWVLEGVLMYLLPEQAAQLTERLARLSPPGSPVLADLALPGVHTGGPFSEGRRNLDDNGSPTRFSTADPIGWFNRRGLHAHAVDAVKLAARHGRTPPPALDDRSPGCPLFQFMEAWT
ncbi:SAM-dependent methyltransferase [Pseudonocardia eucalypti]|uniref:S-adenosyl-L-methionine-dependent methyltransferase n=1 Tax=Pseudonocardia eucalypti TaxID=648755 RepID=A0ABP9RFZ9_9PSEU|nr:methyltransferase (TIGR00027 family) [Pseudonocardia eucalypti]